MPDQPFIQVGNLEFEEIKQSLIDYLKNQDIIKDYNFEGSAAQVLLDILAYNTMYHAFYMNMVANESFLDTAQRLESIISLVKPLGYVVPGRVSAKSTIKIRQGGGSAIIPRYSRFTGNTQNGIAYNFYTNQEYTLDVDGEALLDLYEGKNLYAEIPIRIDPGTQKGFLSNIDIDLRTLKVEVKLDGEDDYRTWAFSSNINTNIDDQTEVFFLERSEMGYFLVFAGRSPTGTDEQVGKRIGENDLVRVSYLISSGSNGNGVSQFSKPASSGIAGTVETIYMSSGGSDEPNIEDIKFFAPKWFAAQGRAVTKQDCQAVLAEETGMGSEDFNVWGGEEMDPPFYGRVFVSITPSADESEQAAAAEAMEILKQKTVVSILPEYLSSQVLVVNFRGNVNYVERKTRLSSVEMKSVMLEELNKKYGKEKFNTTISKSDLINTISNSHEAFSIDPSLIKIQLNLPFPESTTERNLYFRQKEFLLPDSFLIENLQSNLSDELLNFESYGSVVNNRQSIRAFRIHPDTGQKIIEASNVGYFYPERSYATLISGAVTGSGIAQVSSTANIVYGMQNNKLKISVSGLEVVGI